jgi:long-chain acyl-CoA synthetase
VQAHALRATAGLVELGVGEGDTVALLLRNDVPFLEASLAALHLGAYAVPINWHNTPEEVGYILADSGAKALVAHADLLHPLRGALPAGLTVLGVPTPPDVAAPYGIPAAQAALPPGTQEWTAWLERREPSTLPPKAYRGSMIYTSGTTGQPKGVRRGAATPEQDLRRNGMLAAAFGVGAGGGGAARTAITGPMYHSAPNGYVLTHAREGSTIVLMPRFDAEGLLALIERHRITHLHMVPVMFVRLLGLPASVRARYDLSSLRWVVHAAAPCPVEVKRAMIEWWGQVIYEYYGSTELGINTVVDSEAWLARPGTVGRPLAHTDLRIVDEQGHALEPRQVGQIYVRPGAVTGFTYHNQDDKRRAMEREGFLTVGDMGYLDEAGYLFLSDRKIDMIISGGVNIYPAEVEAALLTMPGVRDCAVFGIPDAEYGERVAAAIQPDAGAALSAEGVRAWLGGRLAGYKVPRHLEFHDELPREDSGKIFKRRLREPHWQGAGRNI